MNRLLCFPLALLLGAISLAACGDASAPEEVGPCRGGEDCAAGETCDDGVCVEAPCEGSGCGAEDAGTADASPARDVGGADVGTDDASAEDATAADVVDDASDGAEEDANPPRPDTGPAIPLEWSISPRSGSTGVPLDATIEIVFNQPMNAFRFIPSNFVLTPFEGDPVERTLAYFEETFTLTIAPPDADALLDPLTPHTLRIADFVATADGQELGAPAFVTFATTTYEGRDAHELLARAYAPIVLQEVDVPRLDVPTRVDFDNDFELANNLESAREPGPSFAYFDVTESRTHHFLTYLYYYPGSVPRTGIEFEHDWVIAQLVVEKTEDDSLGRLRAFSTVYHESFNAWRMDPSFYPDGMVVERGDGELIGDLDVSDLVDGRRPTLFIEGGRHGVCLPSAGTAAGPCSPATGATAPFAEDALALTLSPGELAERWDGADDAQLTYDLLSFPETFWALRDRSGPEDGFFGGERTYRAPEVDEGTRPGDRTTFPASLLSDNADGAFGDLPFILQATIDPTRAGVWFVDPAYFYASYLTFPEVFAITYCFNLYLGIDQRGQIEGCPAPDTAD